MRDVGKKQVIIWVELITGEMKLNKRLRSNQKKPWLADTGEDDQGLYTKLGEYFFQ